MNIAKKSLFALLVSSLITASATEKAEEILKVKKSTFVNLVDLLVQRGVINREEGGNLVSAAEQEAAEANAEAKPKAVGQVTPDATAADGETKAKPSKHVSYVPEFVKKEIRDQVRAELKSEVVQDVKQDAKNEGWGIPAALPNWVSAVHPGFDFRVRFGDNFFGSANQTGINLGPYNFLVINSAGGLNNALRNSPGAANYAYFNNTKDQLTIRERLRLGFDANITDSLKTGVRFATSNIYNPVANDQALGNTGQSYQFAIDRSYFQYDYFDDKKTSWFSFYAGRIINPFMSTDVVFDPDLSFEGVAGSFRLHFNQEDPVVRGYKTASPIGRMGINQGQQTPDSLFMTLGVFPIQNVNFSSTSKWLYAGQLGADLLLFENSRFNIAGSYYEYQNISARYNPINGTGHEYDWTAPQFMQRGNSMVAISNAFSGPQASSASVCSDATGCLFGLASGFRLLNFTAFYDYLLYGQTHIVLTGDYVKNLGYNRQRILNQFAAGIVNYADSHQARTSAYQARIDIGHPQVQRFGDWNLNFAYRYVQRDAVLDAFTDSIFHNGGTDAKGWVVGSQYAIAKNTWLDMRWYSTQAIDGPKYNVDTFNFDLNSRF